MSKELNEKLQYASGYGIYKKDNTFVSEDSCLYLEGDRGWLFTAEELRNMADILDEHKLLKAVKQ